LVLRFMAVIASGGGDWSCDLANFRGTRDSDGWHAIRALCDICRQSDRKNTGSSTS
jgi:hypothetical protein